jgi:hypothetical protein
MASWFSTDESDDETRKYKGNMVEDLKEMTAKEKKVSINY